MSTRTDQARSHTERGMRIARWAAAPTLLMALFNVPAGLASSDTDVPAAVAWAATALGLAGLIAAIALLRRVSWGITAVGAVGALNLVGAIAAMVAGWEGGAIGLVLSLLALALILPAVRRS